MSDNENRHQHRETPPWSCGCGNVLYSRAIAAEVGVPKLPERDHQYLRRVVNKNSVAPLSEIATALPGVSTHPVSQALLTDDIHQNETLPRCKEDGEEG